MVAKLAPVTGTPTRATCKSLLPKNTDSRATSAATLFRAASSSAALISRSRASRDLAASACAFCTSSALSCRVLISSSSAWCCASACFLAAKRASIVFTTPAPLSTLFVSRLKNALNSHRR